MKKILDKFLSFPLWYHLIFAVVLAGIILICTLKWLDVYTRHNEAIVVPDVKGLKLEKAEEFFKKSGLRYTVIDSVFSKETVPGAIVEIVPAAGSKVKEGRNILVTVNAITSQMGSIPNVIDLSVRQATALLRANGFEQITVEYVPGAYKDLAIGVEINGREVNTSELIPLNTSITLVVSSGESEVFEDDSIEIENLPVQKLESEDESWF